MPGPGAGDGVVIGHISGVWGVHGWVKVYSWTEPATALFDYQPWFLGDDRRQASVVEWRQQGPRLVARLDGVETADAAASLVEQSIRIPLDALPPPRPGQFYWHDLIGLNVVNLEGESLGRIDGMLATGANDVMDVATDSGCHVLIPFVIDRYVRAVELRRGRVVVDWPSEWIE